MNRPVLTIAIVSLIVGMNGFVRDARAGGIILYELGTPDVGRASAGWAARAGDAATVFTNPAGMSRLSGQNMLIGGQALYGSFNFTPNQGTSVPGNDGGNAVGWLPGGSVFYTHEISSGWSAGLGAFSYFGLSAEYDAGWVGRYYTQKSTLAGLTLMPAISYRVNPQLSFGAGLNWMFGFFEQDNAVKNITQPGDGAFELKDNTQGFGANVGVLWEPNETSRVGVTYVSQVKLDFKDTPAFSGLDPLMQAALTRSGILGAEMNLGVTVPNMVMASAYHELSDTWAVMGNVGWQNWNSFGKVNVSIADTLLSATTDLDYKDTWNVAVGAEWKITEAWLATGGVAYDSSPVDPSDVTLQLPMSDAWRFALGGQWTVNEQVQLGLAYELTWMGDQNIDQSRQVSYYTVNHVAGQFESMALQAFVVNLVWKI